MAEHNPYRLMATVQGRLQHSPWHVASPEAALEQLEALRSSGEWPQGAEAMLLGPRPDVPAWRLGWVPLTDEELADHG